MTAGTRPPFHITNEREGHCQIGDSTHTHAADCGLTFARYAVPRLNLHDALLDFVRSVAEYDVYAEQAADLEGMAGARALRQVVAELELRAQRLMKRVREEGL